MNNIRKDLDRFNPNGILNQYDIKFKKRFNDYYKKKSLLMKIFIFFKIKK